MNEIIYKSNLEAIRSSNKIIADKIESEDYQLNNKYQIAICNSKANIPVVKINFENNEFYINSKYNPDKQVEEWYGKFEEIKFGSTFFMFGFGSGLCIKKLIKDTPESVNIIVYEPCLDIFLKVIEEIDITWAFKDRKIHLFLDGINDKTIKMILSNIINSANIGLFKTSVHMGYNNLFEDKIIENMKVVKECLENIRFLENTHVLFADVSAKNLLNNACRIPYSNSIAQLKGKIPIDRPAIIVGAGPSLKKNIKELKKIKNRALIIAVDTALKPLLNENIIPDLYITVDAMKPVSLFEDDRIKDIPVIFECTANSDVIKNHQAKIFYHINDLYSNKLYLTTNVECGILSTGGSVSNTAFSLAQYIGIKTIILVGQDLAYSGNRSHIEGSFSEEEIAVRTKEGAKTMVEDIYGKMVPTQLNMLKFKIWFEEKIEELGNGIKVYDATEGGAKIKGTEIMNLKDVIELTCPEGNINYSEIISELPCPFDEEAIEKCKKYFVETIEILNKGQKKAKEGIRYYNKLIKSFGKNNINSKEVIKLNKKISRITEFIEKDPVMGIVIENIAKLNISLLNVVYDIEDDIKDEGNMIAKQGILFLRSIDTAIDNLIPLAENTVGSTFKEIK